MGVYKILDNLKILSINTDMVNMSAVGDISEFINNKPIVKYPFVNIDVIKSDVVNYSNAYTVRLYVCDRNEPYIAYNKTEAILNTILKKNDMFDYNYTINFFKFDFLDNVHGVWVDMKINSNIQSDCDDNFITDCDNYILMENGDLIKVDVV